MNGSSELGRIALILGVIGVGLVVAGIVIGLTAQSGMSDPAAGVALRTGALLGAVALVLPSIRKPSLPVLLGSAVVVALVFIRPGLIWVAVTAGVAWWLSGRQRRTDSRDR